MKIAILGAAGRMGAMLCELSPAYSCQVVSRVDIREGFNSEISPEAEGVIDFSFHSAVPEFVARAAELKIPYVLGTTGLTAEEQAAVDEASLIIPVVQSGNYSLGVNVLLGLVRKAAQVLDNSYDIEIVEMHHRHKKDAPSGTALMLAQAANVARGGDSPFIYGREGQTGERPVGEIALHSLRGGSVIGDHIVTFAGQLERIELVHKAQSREAFAAGALKALLWAKNQPAGKYSMLDVLGM